MNSEMTVRKGIWGLPGISAKELLAGAFALLLLCLPAFSQGSFGRILGTVTDESGGVVGGATVTVVDTERGIARTLATDDAGQYNAPNLTAGKYTVSAEAKGFKKLERENVVVEVGHEVRVDLTVEPGEQNQTVTVTESVPLVETTNASMGGTLENTDIIDLPLNGRDYQNLLSLRPGVFLQPGGGPWTESANGARPDETVWMVEGVINFDFDRGSPIVNRPNAFTDGSTIMPLDAIQEFNLIENPKAEYGWKSGAVVNVGIKSGTNQFHGSAYAFGRYQGWDARNFYNVENPISGCAVVTNGECAQTLAQLKQFGAVIGGPIKKDKLFFFAGYEGLRSFIGFDADTTVPESVSTGNPRTSMIDAITALQNAHITVSPVTLALTGCTGGATPVCMGSPYLPANGASTTFLSTYPTNNQSDNGVAKIDYHPNDKNTINGMFWYSHYDGVGQAATNASVLASQTAPARAWSDTASWVYTRSSNVVNEMRFGYDRLSFAAADIDVGIPPNGTGPIPIDTGVTDPKAGGAPPIFVKGFGSIGTGLIGGTPNYPQYGGPMPYYDFQDSVSILKGKHSFKFGLEYTYIETNEALYNNGRGRFNFNGGQTPGLADCAGGSCPLEDFFAGRPSGGQVQTGSPAIKMTWMSTAGFIQDDWRITPKVIVNLGLRYQYVTPMREANDGIGSFDPTSVSGMVQQTSSSSLWSGDHRDFEPRLGVAWDVTGKGTTVLRAGFGIVHEGWPAATFTGASGFQNAATTISAIPTAALLVCVGIAGENTCPATGGGNISRGAASLSPNQLCWNAGPVGMGLAPGCVSGGTTALPSNVGPPQCGDGVGADPSPCNLLGVDPHLKTPFVMNYNFGIAHSFGPNMSLQVAYVGNKGYRLLSFLDVNQPQLGSAYCLNTLTAAQATDACNPSGPDFISGVTAVAGGNPQASQESRPYFAKFPYLGFINFVGNQAYSNYNSMQVTFTRRMSHGLAITAGYTYGHGLDTGSLNRFGVQPEDSTNLAGEYSSSDFDVRHRLTATITYTLPGKKGYGQWLEGWQINNIVTLQTGQPWTAWDSTDNFSGTEENVDRWNIGGNPTNFRSSYNSSAYCLGFDGTLSTATNTPSSITCAITNPYSTTQDLSGNALTSAIAGCTSKAVSGPTLAQAGCYVSPNGQSFLTPPAQGTFGNMGRNIFRDSGFKDWDFSIFKSFTIKERYGIQARWEIFNVLNHPTAANPYANGFDTGNSLGGGEIGAALATPDVAAGNPLIGSGSSRVMQLGLKITF
jgi:hypothetical protein